MTNSQDDVVLDSWRVKAFFSFFDTFLPCTDEAKAVVGGISSDEIRELKSLMLESEVITVPAVFFGGLTLIERANVLLSVDKDNAERSIDNLAPMILSGSRDIIENAINTLADRIAKKPLS